MEGTHEEAVAGVFEVHPFPEEIGVALHGTGVKPDLTVFWFSNTLKCRLRMSVQMRS